MADAKDAANSSIPTTAIGKAADAEADTYADAADTADAAEEDEDTGGGWRAVSMAG